MSGLSTKEARKKQSVMGYWMQVRQRVEGDGGLNLICLLLQALMIARRKFDVVIYHGLRALDRYDRVQRSPFNRLVRVSF